MHLSEREKNLEHGDFMTIPFMTGALIFVPQIISFVAMLFLVIYGIREIRRGHIGRIELAANVFLVWQLFFPVWASLPEYFQLYLNVGSVVAIVALVTYFTRTSIPSGFYKFTLVTYGSIAVVAAVVAFFVGII